MTKGPAVSKGDVLYQGKAKRLSHTSDPGVLWVEYLDQATAFNGEKKDHISGKGELNARISALLFEYLDGRGISSHFLEQVSATEQLVSRVQIVPLEVVVRNVAAGSLTKRLGIEEGTPLPRPLVEYFYKDDDLGDPLLNDEHIGLLELATPQELAEIRRQALEVNREMGALFDEAGVRLVDFKLEFGRAPDGQILLADEISPDNCRLWDKESGQKLDKDVYRRGLGELVPVYQQVEALLSEALLKDDR